MGSPWTHATKAARRRRRRRAVAESLRKQYTAENRRFSSRLEYGVNRYTGKPRCKFWEPEPPKETRDNPHHSYSSSSWDHFAEACMKYGLPAFGWWGGTFQR